MAETSLKNIAKHYYTTPEDVQEAINNGADQLTLYKELLEYIETGAVEDMRCTVFVARRFQKREQDSDEPLDVAMQSKPDDAPLSEADRGELQGLLAEVQAGPVEGSTAEEIVREAREELDF